MLGYIFMVAFKAVFSLVLYVPDFYAMVQHGVTGEISGEKTISGYIEVDNGKIFYEKTGEGEAFVFIHDGIVHRETWDDQFKYFAGDYKVVRYDRRGYGRSEPPTAVFSNIEDLHQLFKQLKIPSAHLMGCSAGGRLAIDFTLAYPELVKSLILVGPAVNGYGFTEHFFTRGGRYKADYKGNTDAWIKYWTMEDPYEMAASNTAARERLRKMMENNHQNFNPDNTVFWREDFPSARGRLAEIKVPTLVVVGEYDHPDVHAHTGIISCGMTGAQRVVIRGAGHLVHMEQPDIFNRLVGQFLKNEDFIAVIKKEGACKAVALFHKIRLQKPDEIPFTETAVNNLGYEFLQCGKTDEAQLLFKLNVEAYPKSFNVYDSYGEILLTQGDTLHSVENYKKSLQLNPNNNNAVAILRELGVN
ncbi:MAG: alpha/beta fold hydrolase [candidate division Zixibacteria bacterium]|nr:alpha/beta fold hydrolase [candidate division Zixibacteria bacterium]MDD5426426.1 alpha/beta fold hydrolase [candidate division Zixibacteria bacterium]